MKIGELARATGFKDKTIRYYERQGVLPGPERTSSGYREYGPRDVDRLQFLRKAKRLGLSLDDIKDVLQIHDRREPTCLHVRELLEEKLALVDSLLRDLREFRKQLVTLKKTGYGHRGLPTFRGPHLWLHREQRVWRQRPRPRIHPLDESGHGLNEEKEG